jgi:uncharacterized protein (TIGR03792 family)
MSYRYITNERRPVEILVFRMNPQHVDEFIAIDHEVWTLGEALMPGLNDVPFLSKEVWLDDSKPGEVTLVFVWDTQDAWNRVGEPSFQAELQKQFDEKFPHPIELISAPHEDSRFGIHRVTRFERINPASLPSTS